MAGPSEDARDALPAVFDRVARRYRSCGRGARGYVGSKLRRDPVHRDVLQIAAHGGFGDVVDAGCGRGQLGIALLEAGLARSVLGLDRTAAHLEQAGRAASGLPFSPALQDFARNQNLPDADTVLLVDVIYQLRPDVQDALLAAAARAARRHVLIRTFDPSRGLRSLLTMAAERVLRFVSPHSGLQVRPPAVEHLASVLRAAGFTVVVQPCWRGTPFANVLLLARRPDQPAF